MKRTLLYILLATLSNTMLLAKVSARDSSVMPLTGGFVLSFSTLSSGSVSASHINFQDSITKKKIKEVAPAKRQPKPERINDPLDGARPDMRPQSSGIDRKRGAPDHLAPNNRPQQHGGDHGPRPGGPRGH